MVVKVMSGTTGKSKELTTLPVSTAILDSSGTIVAVNDTWKLFAQRNGFRLPNFGIGTNYLNHCLSDQRQPSLRPKELKELLAGQRILVTLIYPCHSPREKRWFSLIAFPLSLDHHHQAGVAILHIDLTQTVPLSNMKDVQVSYLTGKTADTLSTNTISGRIEHSILETLSSQLTTMFLRDSRAAVRSKAPTQLAAEGFATALTKRQREVLRLLGEGKTNREIAQALFRSPHTIKLHVAAILERLHLRTRTEAALIASKIYTESFSLNHTDDNSARPSDRSFREETLAD